MAKFRCPRCQHMNQEPDDRIGLVVLCQGCQQKLRVPSRKPELRQDVLQTSSSIATDALAAPADINELPTLEPNDEVRSHERLEQSDECGQKGQRDGNRREFPIRPQITKNTRQVIQGQKVFMILDRSKRGAKVQLLGDCFK